MTTRLSKYAKNAPLEKLYGLLDNVVRFVDCPLKDREEFLALWNSRFPAELLTSLSAMGKYGLDVNNRAICSPRFTTEIDGRLVSALIYPDSLGPANAERQRAGHFQFAIGMLPSLCGPGSFIRQINLDNGGYMTLMFSPDELAAHFGESKADELLKWMVLCADIREDLIRAKQTITDVFYMAKTAGQIKRMVPELLQYLDAEQQKAFEEQKRSSTVPLEWAPYPKKNIEDMLVQISKGHLLTGMHKPGLSEAAVRRIDNMTWARYARRV